MARSNPGAYNAAMVAYSRAVNGGQSVRQATTQFLGTIDAAWRRRPSTASSVLWIGSGRCGRQAVVSRRKPTVHTLATNALGAAATGLRQQHAQLLQQDMSIYPYAAPTLAKRTDVIFGDAGAPAPQPNSPAAPRAPLQGLQPLTPEL